MRYHLLAAVAGSALAANAFAQDVSTADLGAEVVVTGQRASQQRAISAKRDALGVLDVAAADEIGRLPDRNVAEVIEHLPGVGVTYDQG
jgi:outer membrane cobalamin receptor